MKNLFSRGELSQKPIEKAETIPSEWYLNKDIYEFEQKYVFSDFWQFVCHGSELVADDPVFADIAGNPVVIVRDKQNEPRAFYNVCRHRGGPLTLKKGGNPVLQCRYHGWTYLLDGSLRGIPQFDRVDLFDKKDYGLVPIPLEIWQDLIFVHLSDEQKKIDYFVDGISEKIAPLHFADLKFYTKQSYMINCNWKVYVDNFLEGYHLPIVHPELSKLLDYRNYVTETHSWYSLQHSPFRNAENIYGSAEGEAYYYFIFPNIMLNILPDRLQTNVVRPLSPDKTEVIFKYYYREIESSEAQKKILDDIQYSHIIQLEDMEICEAVQRGLHSNAYEKGRFSVEREQGVYHFQSILKRLIRSVVTQSNK